jgi:hypothetical protein
MRASDIRNGVSYAVTGREIQLAKVVVYGVERGSDPLQFRCLVEAGQVYTGWHKQNGSLDMAYAGPGEKVLLSSRDILRPWPEEEERRRKVMTQREGIRAAMSEMDRLLRDLGLPDSQVHLVQLPDGFIAVTVLGIEEVRKLHDQKAAAKTYPIGVAWVSGKPTTAGAGPEIPEPP